MNVLYLEDHPADAELVRAQLYAQHPTWQLDWVSTIAEALVRIEQFEASYGPSATSPTGALPCLRYDLILSDLNLPDGSGQVLLAAVRQRHLPLPVVILTGTGHEEVIRTFLRAGADDYVAKGKDYLLTLADTLQAALLQFRRVARRRSRHLTVLYADADSATALNATAEMHRSAAHLHFEILESAPQVLNRLASENRPPEVILLDQRVTGGYATDLVKEIIQVLKLDLPIILLLEHGEDELGHQALQMGAADYLIKEEGVFLRLPTVIENAWLRSQATRREEALSEERTRLASILDSTMDAIITIDEQQNIVLFNRAAERIFGWPSAEMIGQSLDRLLPERFRTDHRLHLERFAQSAVSQRPTNPSTAALSGRRSDGSEFPFEASISRVLVSERQLLTVILRDTTERDRADQLVRASEERFREIAETIHEVFWIADPMRQQVLYVSPAYERIWGRTCASLYANPDHWIQFIHPEDHDRILQEIRSFKGTGDQEFQIVRPDGTIRWIRNRSFSSRFEHGKIVRILGVAEDVTDRKQAESERRRLEEQFRQAQKMEAIGQLSAGVAHDFNNLLTAIQLNASMVEATPNLPANCQEATQEIERACERASNLTRQLLTFSRRQTLQLRDLDLNRIVSEMAQMLRRMVGEDIVMDLSYTPQPLIAHFDQSMIEQVLLNLVVNARDAMPNGGKISIQTTCMAFSSQDDVHPSRRTGHFLCLKVTDNGTGIPPETINRIFEPFFTTKDIDRGTGLGLASVYGILEQHQGWVEVESSVGEGSSFRVFLPQINRPEIFNLPKPAPTINAAGHETVLIVEDQAPIRNIVRQWLTKLGYKILEAEDAKLALELWEQHQDSIDLLLTDLVLPGGMSGHELAAQLRTESPKLKIIYCSGYSAKLAGKDFPLDEGTHFLRKPYTPKKLAEMIRSCLDTVPTA